MLNIYSKVIWSCRGNIPPEGAAATTTASRTDSVLCSVLYVIYFVAHSSDDSDSLLDFLFAQEIYLGGGQDSGMVSVITTE